MARAAAAMPDLGRRRALTLSLGALSLGGAAVSLAPAAARAQSGWTTMRGETSRSGQPPSSSQGRAPSPIGQGPSSPGQDSSSLDGSGWTGLRGETSQWQGALQALGGHTEGDDIVVDLPADVLFDFDKSNIRRDANEALTHLLTIVEAQASGGPIRVEGHTDSKGGEAYNMGLSQRRAASVKAWLVAHRVAAGRISTVGYGKTRPRVGNTKPDGSDDPQGRQQNRRVTVVIRQG